MTSTREGSAPACSSSRSTHRRAPPLAVHRDDVRHEASGGGLVRLGRLRLDRVANVAEFTDALARVVAGGTAPDPEAVTQPAGAGSRPRELAP
ncbi:hypothetical protein ACFWU3_35590 [Streptomyces sp. NPDC058685]|uniref:hypothetical protein n=1 Tax=Streptomyces sp. NPDC058685 TaxID=3346598 RepID=UPI00364AF82D